MKKIRFIYNQFSLDSMLSSIILRELIETTEVFKEGCEFIYSQYNRIKWTLGDSETDYTFVLGCELEDHQIAELDSKSLHTVIFSYVNGKQIKKIEHVFQYAPNIFDGNVVDDVELISHNSIVMLINKFCLDEFSLNVYDNIDSNLVNLIKAVHLYTNHLKMNQEEIFTLYNNYDNICDSVTTGKIFFHLPPPPKSTNKIKRIQTARGIIDRNFEKMLYGNTQKNMLIPTVQVGEEFYHDVARSLSFPYNEFITYEDIRFWRVWKITVIDNPKKALDIAAIIDHRDSWFENGVLVLLADSPR